MVGDFGRSASRVRVTSAQPLSQHVGLGVRPWLPGVAVFALALLARLLGLDRRSVWFDETGTYLNAHVPWDRLLAAIREDVHPPLGYVLFHLWPWIDSGDALFRLPAALLGALAAPLAWAWARRLAGPRVGLVTGAFVALAPFGVDLGQEARMYGLFFALWAGSLLQLDRVLQRPTVGRATGYALLAVALLYTHYYAAFFLAAQGLSVLVGGWALGIGWRLSASPRPASDGGGRLRAPGAWWALSALAVAGVLFLPWLPVLIEQAGSVRGGYWIEAPRLATLWTTFRALAAHTPPDSQLGLPLRVAYVLLAGLMLFGGWLIIHARREWVAVASLVVPPVLAILVSLLVAPVYALRYVSPLLVPFGFVAARGALGLPRPWLRAAGLAILFFPVLVSLPPLYLDPGYSRADLRAAAAYIRAQSVPDDRVIHLGDFTAAPFRYYRVALPAVTLQSDDRAELCAGLRGAAHGWLVTAYAPDDDAARATAEAGITDPGYAGRLLDEPAARFLGVSVFKVRTGC